MPLIPFSAALERAGDNPNILLGNGFSIAYSAALFTYASLYHRAIVDRGEIRLQQVFEEFDTMDFELVMKSLQSSSAISQLYECNEDCAARMREDITNLRAALINVIVESHPEYLHRIQPNQYNNTSSFLRNFQSFYTTNYDFLLYWCLFGGIRPLRDHITDGFFPDEENILSWNKDNEQNLYYLHGALHLYHKGTRIKKIQYNENGVLTEQVRANIEDGKFPMIVAEGTSEQKLEKIESNKYLSHALSSLSTANGALFIHGHSMSENDNHIWDIIAKNNGFDELFVSIYGDENTPQNTAIRTKAQRIAGQRSVTFYSSESVPLWRNEA